MNEEKLKVAANLYSQGNKSQAANLLGEIIRQDPDNIYAWYGLAMSLDDSDKKIFCLNKVLALEPSHQKAQQLLRQLQSTQQPSSPIQNEVKHPNQSPSQKTISRNSIKQSIKKSTPIERKLIYILASSLSNLKFWIQML